MRETLLLLALIATTALRVGTGGLSRRAAIAGGAAVTLLPPPGFASSGSMAGKTVLIVRCPKSNLLLYTPAQNTRRTRFHRRVRTAGWALPRQIAWPRWEPR